MNRVWNQMIVKFDSWRRHFYKGFIAGSRLTMSPCCWSRTDLQYRKWEDLLKNDTD